MKERVESALGRQHEPDWGSIHWTHKHGMIEGLNLLYGNFDTGRSVEVWKGQERAFYRLRQNSKGRTGGWQSRRHHRLPLR